MSMFSIFEISGSAMTAQSQRMNVTASNMANADSVASPELADLHVDDVYNPVDPAGLQDRLQRAGFVDVAVDWHDFGWRAHARRPDPSSRHV